VHLRKKPIDPGVDRAVLADLTEGMSAAEIRFIVDQATMNAVRRVFPTTSETTVDPASVRVVQLDFDDALMKQAAASERPKPQQPVLFGAM